MEIENIEIFVSKDDSNICRVCLATNEINQCIFDTNRNNSNNTKINNLLEKLRLCSGIEILENDGLPATICIGCITRIDNAHELRKQCQQSDIQLRKLYGKLQKQYGTNRCKPTQDKWCQTNYPFPSDSVKDENEILTVNHNSSSDINLNCNVKLIEEHKGNKTNHVKHDEFNNSLNKQNIRGKCTLAESEKNVSGRDAYRTRRMTMFKRVTSIENLKHNKERQRQYIKKKWDTLESDHLTDAHSMKLHVCTKCNRHYSSKKSLDRHLTTHQEKTFTCNKCNKQFFHLDKLVEHSKLHEVKEKPKPVLCRICNKNFRKTDTMVRHLNVHKRANPKEVLSILKEIRDKRKLDNTTESEKADVKVKNGDDKKELEKDFTENDDTISDKVETCTLQTERRNSTSSLLFLDVNASENESVDGNTLYNCKYCTKQYATEKSLEKHMLIHAEKKFVCNVCNMKFYRQDRLQSHKNRYGHDENNTSPETQKPADEKSTIKLINSWIREELDSDNEGKGFPCKICGKSYDTKKSLSKHQLNAHNSEEEACSSCSDICNWDEKHKEQQNVTEGSKQYQCIECNKCFENDHKLQKHMRVHERHKEGQDVNFKRFLCHICSKTFRHNTGLVFHMRTHTGYKPHVCKYCGRGFASNSNRINHERTHTGDRPFVCHFCSAAFAKSCTLKAHITTHTGEANYHCKTCGKSFRRLKYLKEHRFTHTGEKPYACKICGTAYSHSGSLFVHEKKCKAQYNSYQSNSTQNTESYCQSETTSPNVTPIITILPQVQLNVSDTLNTQNSKSYVDNQMINSHDMNNLNTVSSSDLHVHSNSDIPDVSLTIKSFALIRQMFQS